MRFNGINNCYQQELQSWAIYYIDINESLENKKKRLICILKSLIFCRYISELTNQKTFFSQLYKNGNIFCNLMSFALQDAFKTANRYPKSIFCTAFQHFSG